jgi:5-methylthioadenosine/S-adenosylhomocysteine deaminase
VKTAANAYLLPMHRQPEATVIKKPVDKLISAGWIIPIRPVGCVLSLHSLVINGNVIVDILPTELAAKQYQAKEQLNLPEHVLTPGLINSHGHAAMSLFRGMADDQPLDSWLNEYIWPAEAQWVDEQFVRDGTELAIAEMLRSGTTCFSDMYFFPNITAQVASEAGIRSQITFPVFDFPSKWGASPDEYIDKGLALKTTFSQNELINVVFGPHAPYTVSTEPLKRIGTLAKELKTSIHIHLHETQQEVETAIKETGVRPITRLNELGLLGPHAQLVHMCAIDDNDIKLVQQSGAHIVHCPQSNLKLASGFCPVQQLLEAQINVALGTDGAASNNSLDMFAEMRTAALLSKAVSNNAQAMNDWQALEAATLSGAKAMGMDSKIGSLEIGKRADVIAIDFSQIEQQPVYQPISQVVYTQCGQHVTHSWIDGKLVLNERQPVNLDTLAIRTKAREWRQKIQ